MPPCRRVPQDRGQGQVHEHLGSAQQRNTWSTGEECAVEDLEVWCALPIAATAAGASMPPPSIVTTERDGASGGGTVAERCRSRGRRRPLDSPRPGVPQVPYSPGASPAGTSGAPAVLLSGTYAWVSGACAPEYGANRKPIRKASTNRTATARTLHLLPDPTRPSDANRPGDLWSYPFVKSPKVDARRAELCNGELRACGRPHYRFSVFEILRRCSSYCICRSNGNRHIRTGVRSMGMC